MSDLTITVTVTSGIFSYSGTSSTGWAVKTDGSIQPPTSTNGGTGDVEFKLAGSGNFTGFNVRKPNTSFNSDLWASKNTLISFNLTPLLPSPWPGTASTDAVNSLKFTLQYSSLNQNNGRYRLTVTDSSGTYSDDPKIHNDPVT